MNNQIRLYKRVLKNGWLIIFFLVFANAFFSTVLTSSISNYEFQLESNFKKNSGYIVTSKELLTDNDSYILLESSTPLYSNGERITNIYADIIMVVPNHNYKYYKTPSPNELYISKNILNSFNNRSKEIFVKENNDQHKYQVKDTIPVEYGLSEQKIDANKGVIILGYNEALINPDNTFLTIVKDITAHNLESVITINNLVTANKDLLLVAIPLFLLFLAIEFILWIVLFYSHKDNRKLIQRVKNCGGDNKIIKGQSLIIFLLNLIVGVVSTLIPLLFLNAVNYLIAITPLVLIIILSGVDYIKNRKKETSYVPH